MKRGEVHFVGSDSHGSRERIFRLGDAYAYTERKFGIACAEDIFIKNPRRILADAKKRKHSSAVHRK